MTLAGKRILIFGDSLSQRGGRSAPVQFAVTESSARTSSVPGDLLGSYLLEAGASAVRVNAKVSRSAHNFFRIEPAAELLAADKAWRPTTVIVLLGTNDLGLNMSVDAQSMNAIREAFTSIGADVWAVGPPAFAAAKYSNNTDAVVTMMKQVFGSNRFIDARSLTQDLTSSGRSSDGVHFTASGAKLFAQRMAAVLIPLLSGTASTGVIPGTSKGSASIPASQSSFIEPLSFGFGVGAIALLVAGGIWFIRTRRQKSL